MDTIEITPRQQEFVRQLEKDRVRRMSPEERAQRIQDRLDQAGIPKKFRHITFATFNPTAKAGLDPAAYAIAQRFAEDGCFNDKTGLLLLGTPGNGKSSLGVCILRDMIDRHQGAIPVRFWNVPRGLIAIKQEFGKEDQKATPILNLAKFPLLMLDDLGKHRWSQWAKDEFYSLLDEMWAEEKPLIITTNEKEEDFMALDEALISRILGCCHMVRVQGADHRLAVQAELRGVEGEGVTS